jgi:dCMP deaminase
MELQFKTRSSKWDRRLLALAKLVASWSKDPSTKVGAIIVDSRNVVVGIGYNGFARGVDDSNERLTNRDAKYKHTVHAEVNAILTAGDKARGASLYVAPGFGVPNICHDCAKFAIQAGIVEVVGPEPMEGYERWAESLAISRQMLVEAGVHFRASHDG